MELSIALEMRHSASEMRTNRTGSRESFLSIAKDENLLFYQEGGRAEGKICRVADLE
jgi:hypothetical protein